jgi:DNA-binding response OmpR family regulator
MGRPTILLVEDEPDMRRVISVSLKGAGYDVLSASSAESGLEMSRRHKPSMILLDIMLPKMDGFEMLRQLRQESEAPVVCVTGRTSSTDVLLGFGFGADDYITKPFSMEELKARIKAVLKRTNPAPKTSDGAQVKFGKLEIDFERHEVLIQGKPRYFAPKEYQLLRVLIEADGKVLSREQLLEAVWNPAKRDHVDVRTVDQHIAQLRRDLGHEKRRIVTVKQAGYKFDSR